MIHQVDNTQAQFIFAHPTLAKTAVQAAKGAGLPEGRVFLFSDEPNAPVEGCQDWRSFLPSPAEADAYNFPVLSEQEATTTTATVNYSSGTTGLPKGVEVTHHNLIANLDYFIELSHLRSLYLGYNLIRDLSKLREMKTLQEIDLEHNLIDSVDSMNHLIEADLLVFVIKKNPATR